MILQQCTETKQAFNQLVKVEQSLSVKQSLQNSPLLMTQGKKIGVIQQIIKVVEFFLSVTGKELEPYQIQILAGDLYERFRTDTLDDIVLMFKMARQGEFGRIYRCDTLEIMSWVEKYMEVKAIEREKLIAKGKRLNLILVDDLDDDQPMSDEAMAKFDELLKTLKAPQPNERAAMLADKNKELFDYAAYCESLQETVLCLTEVQLENRMINISKFSNPEVWEIYNNELQKRKNKPLKPSTERDGIIIIDI